ncbi:MAG: PQQ-binding-like beta-propeller repeat protein [Gemmatimonadota bacterium]|jgi:quinoprotein glucose dehydrogenase
MVLIAGTASPLAAQTWPYIGGDAAHTRYTEADQLDATNFESLETAWIWRGDNFGPRPEATSRSTPIYVDGLLYTVAGTRRTVVAIDPATGETIWTFREPHTTRWDRGMRNGYGKGVAYGEIDGRGVIYISSPAFFLWALDAKTGHPLEDWGEPVPLEEFPQTGVQDLMLDVIADWDPWLEWDGPAYDPDFGIPRELGHITSSSPPIVVNGVVVVGNSAEQGYNQTRIENAPGDILGYDARTGEQLWKFHVIPRPGEFGHDTWENDAWRTVGDVSSWAPMSADPELGLVYIPTNPPTIDFWGGFRPGDGLFGTSVIALDVQTGERRWHFQTVHHDIWNFDNPTAPIALDVVVDGEPTPILVQTTKQGWAYTWNRETGEPIWPIEERPVPASVIPGEHLSPTQPMPTRPAAYEMQGLTVDDLIDFTPELRAEAEEIVSHYRLGPIFNPPIPPDWNGLRSFVSCPSGATNIFGPTSADPEAGVIFVSTRRGCRSENLAPGVDLDLPDDIMTTGTTISEWAVANRGDFRGPRGLPIFKPPYSQIVAIDMNTGEHVWAVPNGDTPEYIREHPDLQGVDLPNTGRLSYAITMATPTLLLTAEGAGGEPVLHALDKRTGERVGTVELPAPGQYGMMSFVHEGVQYVVVQISGNGMPGGLVALRLPG